MNRIPITSLGYEMLKQELHKLKTVERPTIVEAIAEARAHGDLRENAEYNAAKEKQGFVEGRIREVEHKLAIAEVVDPKALGHLRQIVFGATVLLSNLETEEEFKYQIVGEDEADIKQSKISFSSPIARSLIGKERGDVISVTAPGGLVEYEILEIEYI